MKTSIVVLASLALSGCQASLPTKSSQPSLGLDQALTEIRTSIEKNNKACVDQKCTGGLIIVKATLDLKVQSVETNDGKVTLGIAKVLNTSGSWDHSTSNDDTSSIELVFADPRFESLVAVVSGSQKGETPQTGSSNKLGTTSLLTNNQTSDPDDLAKKKAACEEKGLLGTDHGTCVRSAK
jgi:hypothetical protein